MSRERRNYYRIRFPATTRPILCVDGRSYVVTELSEGGLRVLEAVSLPTPFSGSLTFSDGNVANVRGRVLRRDVETVVSHLVGIEYADVMREQRRLLRLFPLLS